MIMIIIIMIIIEVIRIVIVVIIIMTIIMVMRIKGISPGSTASERKRLVVQIFVHNENHFTAMFVVQIFVFNVLRSQFRTKTSQSRTPSSQCEIRVLSDPTLGKS